MLITPSFKKSLIVEQFQGNYLKYIGLNESRSLNCYYFTTPPPPHPQGGEFFNRGFVFLSQNINIYDLIFFPFSRGCKNEGVRISAIVSEGGLQTKVE